MIVRLKNFIEQLFGNAPQTKKVFDLKDELTADLIEKYNDLLLHGKTEEEAYNIVIAGIGDIDELISQLHIKDEAGKLQDDKKRKISALLLATAVGIYILSVVPVILSAVVIAGNVGLGVVFMFVLIALATGILIYRNAYDPQYQRIDDTMVEEFKEWKSNKRRKSSIAEAISSILWTLTVAVYLIVSFVFGIWAYSWIIFIVAYAVEQIIDAFCEIKGG